MREEIEAKRTERGGWTRETLARWGVPWPPPKGWKKRLEMQRGQRRSADLGAQESTHGPIQKGQGGE